MIFAHPHWFWALAAVPLLAALFLRSERQRARTIARLIAARLYDRLAGSASAGRRRARFVLLLLGLACALAALAQPRWGFSWQEQKRRGRDVLIAIDTSRSMLANDLAPSRLARAKLAAEDLIGQLSGDRVGLIAFAGSAFLQAPLTTDHSAVLNALRELNTEVIPLGGTDLAVAIRTASEAFGKGESDFRALVIITDGEELDEAGTAAAEQVKGAVRIFTVGAGSVEGTIIAVPGRGGRTEYLKDEQGQIVKSRLDEARLRAIAEATGGFYVALRSGPAEMRQIVRDGIDPMSTQEFDAQPSRLPIERYHWPLSAAMALLAAALLIGERRRGAARRMAAAATLLALAWSGGSEARGAESGYALYEQGRYNDAQEAYERQLGKDPHSGLAAFNLGAAAYKNGQLDKALDAFSKALASDDPGLRAKAEYNLGNTLFKRATASKPAPELKGLEDALSHYGEARKLSPEHASAKRNFEITEKRIAQLKQQQEQQKQDEKKEHKPGKEQDQQKQKQQGDEKQEGEGKEQKQPGQKEDGSKPPQSSRANGGEKGQDGKGGESNEKEENSGAGRDKPEAKSENGGKAGQEKQGAKVASPPDDKDAKEGEPSQPESAEKDESPQKPAGELAGAGAGKDVEEQAGQAAGQTAMTEAESAARDRELEARALLDSLSSEDLRGRLLNPAERRRAGRALRDW